MFNEYIIKPTPLSLDKMKNIDSNNHQQKDNQTTMESGHTYKKLMHPDSLNYPNFSKIDETSQNKNLEEQFPSNISSNGSVLQPKFFSSDNMYIK